MQHAAIYYEADGYTTTGQKLMGRQAAGEGYLRAAARSGASRLACHSPNQNAAEHFRKQLAQYGFSGQAHWIPTEDPSSLQAEGVLYLPGPNLSDYAWRRTPARSRAWSLCGVTHTTASHGAMSSITDLLTGPVRSWDALICTSTAVRDTVRILLERQAEYLRWRLGASHFELPQLPVIPLGVHCDDFVFSEEDKARARQELGIGQDDVVALFVGRLSFHAKAHPLQMYTALERAAKGRRVRLVQCGWFANDHIESSFKDGAKALCPSVPNIFLDGRDPQARKRAWASADIFISLSDNIQETFGLTPIEAMAAGLPVIVTDWDGYKDTVRAGVDGFRVPTVMPPTPLGEEFARRHEANIDNYDVYCGLTSQMVAVDPPAMEQACERLISDAGLRRKMGEAGRHRAREVFDWAVIYRRYQALWEELNERRRADPDLQPATAITTRADRLDPFAAFASYPTSLLSDSHQITLLPAGTAKELSARAALPMNSFAGFIHLTEAESGKIIAMLQEAPRNVTELIAAFPPVRHAAIARGLVWMAKMEAIRITPPNA